VVAHRRFGETDGRGKVATALFADRAAEQQRNQLDPNRVGQRLEAKSDLEAADVVVTGQSLDAARPIRDKKTARPSAAE
jgi:hypothetical protein